MTTETQANTSLYIPEELKKWLRIYAAKENVSMKGIIIELIEDFKSENS